MKFNIIFPMAGESKRFNYQFKPFLQISDETFIELAYKYFKNYQNQIHNLYFIITKEQQQKFNIKKKLNELFNDINYDLIILSEKTKGPFQTIKKMILNSNININIPTFICDCDHSIDIEPIINYINNNNLSDISNDNNILISIWDIKTKNENYKDWGIIYFNENNKIIDFSEKILIKNNYQKYYGIIGCYYFQNLNYFINNDYLNISDGLLKLSESGNVKLHSIEIKNAEFFGDPNRLEKTTENRKKKSTIFCDIDGTIIIHEKYPKNESLQLLKNTIYKLNDLKNKNHKIILTTSRNNKKKLLSLLNNYKIPFDDIICNLPPGSRYLINDIKEDIIPTSYSINLIRNYGIQDIELKNDNIQILKILKGNSFSKTILCQNNNYKKNNIFIRKYILKSNENLRHYHKLKRQYYDLQKFNSYILNICPTVFNENDLDYIYYFDLEYLNDYNQINHINENKDLIILNLLKLLNSEIYITKKLNHNSNWINDYFHKKINFENYKKLHPIINDLFNLDIININHKEYIGLNKIFTKINIQQYNSKYLCVIHGDLTFENILYHSKLNDIKLIDLDGSDFIDAIELDFGKLLQSYLSNYELWSNSHQLIKNIDLKNNILNTYEFKNNLIHDKFYNYWSIILNIDDINQIQKIGIFYMCIHLFRMIPYRYDTNFNSCIYCIKELILWLNFLI